MPTNAYVITPHGVATPTRWFEHTPPGLLYHVPSILKHCTEGMREAGVVLLAGIRVKDLMLSATPPTDELKQSGWRLRGTLDAWSTFTKPGSPIVHLGVLDEMQEGRTPLLNGILLPRPQDPVHEWAWAARALARRWTAFHVLTGMPFQRTPGVVGQSLLRRQHRDPRPNAQPLWHWDGYTRKSARPSGWRRELTAGYVARYDVNHCYSTAAGSAMLAWNELELSEDRTFERGVAGYWAFEPAVPAAAWAVKFGADAPLPFNPRARDRKGLCWLTTPVVELLDDHGIAIEVRDSCTAVYEPAQALRESAGFQDGPTSRRLMRRWHEAIRSARFAGEAETWEADSGPLVEAIKRSANEAIGLMCRAGGSIHREDWAETIRDQAWANLLRHAIRNHEAGMGWPVRLSGYDSIWYPHDWAVTDDEPLKSSLAPGKLRLQAAYTAAAYVEHFAAKGVVK